MTGGPGTVGRWREARARARARRRDEREGVLADMMRRARARHARNVRRVYAQEGEPLARTLGRVLYLTACVIVDGPVLLEIVRQVPGWSGWAAYGIALAVAVHFQVKGYRRWFDVDAADARAGPVDTDPPKR